MNMTQHARFKRALQRACIIVDAGHVEIARELLAQFKIELVALSKENPGQLIIGCSAMGIYTVSRKVTEGDGVFDYVEDTLPVFAQFNDIQNDYGFSAIPAPIRIKVLDGIITEEVTDW